MAEFFSERRQLILKLVVQEFVESATAVASETLVRKYNLPISSATVRNELAILEELGYLTHLHTSAGRVPTDVGYRFFVENLMDSAILSTSERHSIQHQFQQVRGEIDQWIHRAATVLTKTTQNAAVVTLPRAYQTRFKHLELIALHDTTVLMVLVFHDGTVRQQTLAIEVAHNQEALRTISTRINERCYDLAGSEIEDLLPNLMQVSHSEPSQKLEQRILTLVVKAMQQLEEKINSQIHSDGLIEMLRQPEFRPSALRGEDAERVVERMRLALEILTKSKILDTLVLRALQNDGVQVTIGSEHETDEMRDYSVVLSRYGIDGTVVGVLGVLGPVRMPYPRSISIVSYLSSIMSDLLTEIYGGEARS